MGFLGLDLSCEDIQLSGQTLTFTVPAVHGTWTGFVSAHGKSLSGMYSQQGANPVPLNFTRSSSGLQGSTSSGSADPNAPRAVTWDDYVFKFMSGGNAVQAYQGGKLVGTIVTVNGEQQVLALPGTDSAKLQKSYQDYQAFNARSHGEAPPTTAAVATNVGSQHPPCSSRLGGVSYWDSSDWKMKMMTRASHMGGDEGLSWKKGLEGAALFHPRAGITQIVTFKNSAAALTLDPRPSFCVYVPLGFDPSVIMIGGSISKKITGNWKHARGPAH